MFAIGMLLAMFVFSYLFVLIGRDLCYLFRRHRKPLPETPKSASDSPSTLLSSAGIQSPTSILVGLIAMKLDVLDTTTVKEITARHGFPIPPTEVIRAIVNDRQGCKISIDYHPSYYSNIPSSVFLFVKDPSKEMKLLDLAKDSPEYKKLLSAFERLLVRREREDAARKDVETQRLAIEAIERLVPGPGDVTPLVELPELPHHGDDVTTGALAYSRANVARVKGNKAAKGAFVQ